MEYRTVDTSTIAGVEEADRLHANGWTTVRVGLFLIYFQRRTER